jgi:hypothetical protein
MAAWSTLIACSKFNYSAVEEKFSITSTPGNYFWSNGYAWGNAKVEGKKVTIACHFGKVKLKTIELKGAGVLKLSKESEIKEGSEQGFEVK